MKNLLVSLVLFIVACPLLQAQIPTTINKKAIAAGANPGQLLTQFTNALKPTSFLSSFAGAKTGILGKAQKAGSALDIANVVSSLAGYAKPGMFKQGTTAKSLMNMGSKVKTMTDAAGLLKSFEGGLKPEAFTSAWSNMRPGWLSALNQLK
jgi:hypothetical protein